MGSYWGRRKRSLTYDSEPAVRKYSVDTEKQEKKEFPETWLWAEEKLE